jgi:hypothetical protein
MLRGSKGTLGLTCEAQAITKKQKGPGIQRPRRKSKALSDLRPERKGELTHECGNDPGLASGIQVVAHQARM